MLMGVPENGTKAKMIQSPIPLTCWPCLCPNLEQELLLRMDALGQGTFRMPPFGSENGRPAQRKQSQQWGPSRAVTHSQESFFPQASWRILLFRALVTRGNLGSPSGPLIPSLFPSQTLLVCINVSLPHLRQGLVVKPSQVGQRKEGRRKS